MNRFISGINIEDDFSLRKRKDRERNNSLFKSLISEEKGSFYGQYGDAETITTNLLKNFHNGGFSEYTDKNGRKCRLECNYGSQVPCKGSSFGNSITVTVNPSLFYSNYDIESTVAHEIMHLFQHGLERIDGVNEKSMFLFYYILSFANSTTLEFSNNFFYALYFVFSIERKANVSSISNFLRTYFGSGKPNSGADINAALKKCDKYNEYEYFMDYFSGAEPRKDDIDYIHECLTRPRKNPYSGNFEPIYEPEMFKCEIFIRNNVKQILYYCEDTIKKARKNAMIYYNA